MSVLEARTTTTNEAKSLEGVAKVNKGLIKVLHRGSVQQIHMILQCRGVSEGSVTHRSYLEHTPELSSLVWLIIYSLFKCFMLIYCSAEAPSAL